MPAALIPIEALAAELTRDGRLMGLDVGEKTIGLALSDVTRTVATPYDTIRRVKFKADASLLIETIQRNQVFGLIVGLPVNFNASEGPRAQSTRAFVRNLTPLLDIPLVLWDERWSTAAAERALIAADASRKKRAQVIDKMAAAFILQGALDRLKGLRSS